MKNWFEKLRFRAKLRMLVVTSTTIAMVFVAVAVIGFDYFEMRHMTSREVATLADVIADNSAVAVAFSDADAARRILKAVQANDGIVAAAAYTQNGEYLADYQREGTTATIPQRASPPSAVFDFWRLRVFRQVMYENEFEGAVYLEYDLTELYVHLLRQAGVVSAGMALALLISLAVSHRLQRVMVRPVRHLAETARTVSVDRNYALRAQTVSSDEFGELTQSFNVMLAEIQERDDKLQEHRQELEMRVAERTAELERATRVAEEAQKTIAEYAGKLERRNTALRKAQERAETASRAKSDFLANMSHEIRSPMTAILGYADILLDEERAADAPASRLDAIETIRRNGAHLLDVINDILDVSKLEAGRMTVERVPCSPAEIVSDVVALMRVRADAKKLDLSIVFDGPIPETILCDPTRLRQILVNLIGNGIKFTEYGAVTVTVGVAHPDEGESMLTISVRDTGIGMAREKINRLFEPFTQADASTTRKYGGTGLGLSISRRFARMLGGDIVATSRPGHGCTFVVRVATGPLDDVEMIEDPSQAIADRLDRRSDDGDGGIRPVTPLHGVRILVAEDTPENQRLLRFYLGKTNADLEMVASGTAVVEAALAARDAGTAFHIILMDMQMPEMDGYAATACLRENGYEGTIIALTAHAMRGDRERCLAAGMDDYVSKPINPAELLGAIHHALDPSRHHSGQRHPGTASRVVHGDDDTVLDRESLLTRFDDDRELVAEMIDIFLERHAAIMEDMQESIAAGDVDALRRHAHALRGSVSNFAAPAATEAARRLEIAAEAAVGADDGALKAAYLRVAAELDRLAPRLRELRAEVGA